MTATRRSAADVPVYSETLPREAASVRLARQLVRRALTAWGQAALEDTSTLIATELVANAVQHAGGHSLRIGVTLVEHGRVRVAVSDKSQTDARVRRPACDAEAGRGLLLVEAVASCWGVDHRRWGKVVWAEVVEDHA
ncbi:ATP-binding protein [Streptomyces durbertensis]|uniref:ATP-binding protein n=1 Tax=Streptomyces durbertensis TaxID=2448886 RepID=A0ABR6EKF7_9ACTN|nr:ATP-binding protein [Streptomyces durbertensis]MBB1245826.1 ATP-binding protein [Streptomyces durbertensis]